MISIRNTAAEEQSKGIECSSVTGYTEASRNLPYSNRTRKASPKHSEWTLLVGCDTFHAQLPHHSQGCCYRCFLVSMMLARSELCVLVHTAVKEKEKEKEPQQKQTNHFLALSPSPAFVLFPLPMQVSQSRVGSYSGAGDAVREYMVMLPPFSLSAKSHGMCFKVHWSVPIPPGSEATQSKWGGFVNPKRQSPSTALLFAPSLF